MREDFFFNATFPVDYSIADIIELANRKYETRVSCSGLPEDHREWNETKQESGYITFNIRSDVEGKEVLALLREAGFGKGDDFTYIEDEALFECNGRRVGTGNEDQLHEFQQFVDKYWKLKGKVEIAGREITGNIGRDEPPEFKRQLWQNLQTGLSKVS